MLISVIIPVYNLAQYVRYPITSVLEQVPSDDIEIIVVDDGSTDESLGVIKGFEGGRSDVKVVTQKNAGVSAARNAGLSIATGKYVTFVDGDDVVSPDAFKILRAIGKQSCLAEIIFEPHLTPVISVQERMMQPLKLPKLYWKSCFSRNTT